MTAVRIVIPARLASSRLPEKLLRVVGGKSVLRWTHEAVSRSRYGDGVVVAVDHPRLADEVERFGGRWVMTDPDLASGTDRIAAAIRDDGSIGPDDVVVNVQGDEPMIDPNSIDAVAGLLVDSPAAEMSTAVTPIRTEADYRDPACVKAVLGDDGRALYFSRSPVPAYRDGGVDWKSDPPPAWKHLGLYAYRRRTLEWFAASEPSTLELAERLEQLRVVQSGREIRVARVDEAAIGIDTEEDLRRFERTLESRLQPILRPAA